MTATPVDLFVVGTSVDPHIGAVLARLGRTVSVCRLDVDRFPAEATVSIEITEPGVRLTVATDAGVFDVSSPKVCWFRRFGRPGLSPHFDPSFEKFARDESEQVVEGLLDLMTPRMWINEYRAARLASSKPHQAALARRLGLRMPETLFTNDPAALRAHVAAHPSSVIKSISRPLLSTAESPRGALFAYTSELDPSKLDADDVRHVPAEFQTLVRPAYEMRVTSFLGEHHAVRIDASDMDPQRRDWRATQDTAAYSACELEPATAELLTGLLAELGLQFAASDFIVEEDGGIVFLEANPHGAWMWLDDVLSVGTITERIATSMRNLVDSLY